jgi:hypothetical protein
MLTRCRNKNCDSYERYGGKGIAVCARWIKSFQAFLDDMGPRPSLKHSLDRFPNGAGDYEPGNCRWATPEQQTANKGNRIVITLGGAIMFLPEAAKILGLDYYSAYRLVQNGVIKGTKRNSSGV